MNAAPVQIARLPATRRQFAKPAERASGPRRRGLRLACHCSAFRVQFPCNSGSARTTHTPTDAGPHLSLNCQLDRLFRAIQSMLRDDRSTPRAAGSIPAGTTSLLAGKYGKHPLQGRRCSGVFALPPRLRCWSSASPEKASAGGRTATRGREHRLGTGSPQPMRSRGGAQCSLRTILEDASVGGVDEQHVGLRPAQDVSGHRAKPLVAARA